MRNRKRRALAVTLALALAFGVGLWRAFVWWNGNDEAATERSVSTATALPAADEGDPTRRLDDRAGGGDRTATAPQPDDADEGSAPDATQRRSGLGTSSAEEGAQSIYLVADAPPEGFLSSPVRGLDTGAPRDLVLWRVEGGRRIRVADGRSGPDGRLHFPEVLVPDRPLELVVTAREEGPQGLDRSAPDVVQSGGLMPPDVRAGRDAAGGTTLRVAASNSRGAIVLANARGVELARVELPLVPLPGRHLIDIPLDEDAAGSFLVSQELPDGRRSEWRVIDVAARPAAKPSAGP